MHGNAIPKYMAHMLCVKEKDMEEIPRGHYSWVLTESPYVSTVELVALQGFYVGNRLIGAAGRGSNGKGYYWLEEEK